jgi:sec-independent protein translocase protein TatB
MFGMGGSEILVILVVALLFLGPERLPEAASKISKGIRDLRKQTRELTSTIENDTEIGGAIRDLKSALRGDEPRGKIQPRPPKPKPAPEADKPPEEVAAVEPPTLPEETGDAEGPDLIRAPQGVVPKSSDGDDEQKG